MITAPPIWKKKLYNRWLLPSGKFNPWLSPVYGNVEGGDMMPKSPTYGAATKSKNPLSRTSAGELSASERAEAWALAMEDAQGFMGPMQGDTIPGVAPGGGSRDHQMGQYGTGGLDIADNRPTADPDAVRKRLYGIMGCA